MFYLILIILVVFSLILFGIIFLVTFLNSVNMLWLGLIPFLFSVMILIIGFSKIKDQHGIHSQKDHDNIERAKKRDREEKEQYQKNLNYARDVAWSNYYAISEEVEKEIDALEHEVAQKRRELQAFECLHDDDKNLESVNRIIYLIEHKRVSSIQEALNKYDDELEAAREKSLREAKEWLDNWNRRREAEERAQRDHENELRYWQQRAHNEKMEELERKRIDKIDDLRKEIEKK